MVQEFHVVSVILQFGEKYGFERISETLEWDSGMPKDEGAGRGWNENE